MDLFKLFDLHYLLAPVPGGDFEFRWVAYALFVLIFGASFSVKNILAKRPLAKLERPFFSGIPGRMQELAVVGLALSFFRDQNIPYLGMRVWFLILALSTVLYLLFTWRNYKKNFAKTLVTREKKEAVDHYLPKSKKSRKKKR